jgi:hypothetical protein
MNDIYLFDETFDKNQSHNYHLSIQTGVSGLSFCILDTVRNKYIGLHHYPIKKIDYTIADLVSIIQTDPILTLAFKSVSHMSVDGRNTLVPLQLFEAQKEKLFFEFNHDQTDASDILYNQLPSIKAVNIFEYPKDFPAKLREIYPKLKVFHRSTAFIEAFVQHSTRWTHAKCAVIINKEEIDIGIAQTQKLEFFNSFDYKEKTDIIYYILNTLERFKLSPTFTEVYFSANLENHDEIYEFLGRYLNIIKFIQPTDQFIYSYIFDELHLTRFANLFNLALCE